MQHEGVKKTLIHTYTNSNDKIRVLTSITYAKCDFMLSIDSSDGCLIGIMTHHGAKK